MDDQMRSDYEVVVVGGGAAGLAGALTLARARRWVLVVDAGQPRNAPASAVHGVLGLDGTPPRELLRRGRSDVRRYGGHVVDGDARAVRRDGDGFVVELADGRACRARCVLVTTGLVDELPDVAGLAERWGRDVVHCPYCHGWEVRDAAVGVLATGPMSVHQALLFRQWSPDVTFFAHRLDLQPDDRERLGACDVRVVDGAVDSLVVTDDRVTGVRLLDGRVEPRDVLAVAPRMVARSEVLRSLGLTAMPHPSGMGEHVPCDARGQSEVPGVWLAGNVTDLSGNVATAAAAGVMAAAQLNLDLVEDETAAAVTRRRALGQAS